jgi:hypothetical protein
MIQHVNKLIIICVCILAVLNTSAQKQPLNIIIPGVNDSAVYITDFVYSKTLKQKYLVGYRYVFDSVFNRPVGSVYVGKLNTDGIIAQYLSIQGNGFHAFPFKAFLEKEDRLTIWSKEFNSGNFMLSRVTVNPINLSFIDSSQIDLRSMCEIDVTDRLSEDEIIINAIRNENGEYIISGCFYNITMNEYAPYVIITDTAGKYKYHTPASDFIQSAPATKPGLSTVSRIITDTVGHYLAYLYASGGTKFLILNDSLRVIKKQPFVEVSDTPLIGPIYSIVYNNYTYVAGISYGYYLGRDTLCFAIKKLNPFGETVTRKILHYDVGSQMLFDLQIGVASKWELLNIDDKGNIYLFFFTYYSPKIHVAKLDTSLNVIWYRIIYLWNVIDLYNVNGIGLTDEEGYIYGMICRDWQNHSSCFTNTIPYLARFDNNGVFSSLNDSELNNIRTVISPNPATNSITVNSNHEVVNVTIRNITGLQLSTSSSNELDISAMSCGVYFIEVVYKDGSRTVHRVLKN